MVVGIIRFGRGVYQQAETYQADHAQNDHDESVLGTLPGGRPKVAGQSFGGQ